MKFTLEANIKFINLIEDLTKETGDIKEIYNDIYNKKFSELLKDKNLENVKSAKELEKRDFENRFEYGKYIFERLEKCTFGEVVLDEQLWNYISCFYLEKFISSSKVQNRYRFINTFRDLKRMQARTPWFLYYLARENSLFTLCTPLNAHSNMCEQFVSRQELVRNKSISELCQNLYFDKKSNKLKSNAAKHEKDKDGNFQEGCLYPRLTKTVGKLNKIYDLWNIDKDDLEELIGKEFGTWKHKK